MSDLRPTVSKERQARMLASLGTPLPSAERQLTLFDRFAADIPAEYSAIVEFFDALPLFVSGALTSFTEKGPLKAIRRTTRYLDHDFSVTIKPIILEPDDPSSPRAKYERKEMIAAEREQNLYRVLRKMASENTVTRDVTPTHVTFVCTVYELRKRLADVCRGLTAAEVRESLKVLAETPLDIKDETTGKKIYAGPYITLQYVSDRDDDSGKRTLCKISINELATKAIINGLYDRIHYKRLMSLSSALSQWLYETVTRQFRQASPTMAYRITLSRILRDGPLREYRELRKAAEKVRKAIEDLVQADVIAAFPPPTEKPSYKEKRGGGRRALEDITFEWYLSESVVKDIKSDNAARDAREARLAAVR